MKFNYKAAQPGVNNLVQAFSRPIAQEAEERELNNLSNADYRRARTQKEDAETVGIKQRTDFLGDPESFISSQSGVPIPLVKKFLDRNKSGNFGIQDQPNDDDGNPVPGVPITEVPSELSPYIDKLTQAFQTYGAVRGADKANPEQIAGARGQYRDQASTEQVQNLIRSGRIDDASALNQGSKIGQQVRLFDNIGGTGGVFSPATGNVVAENNPLLRAHIEKSRKKDKADPDYNDPEQDTLAPWANIRDPKKRDDAKIRFGLAADKQIDKYTEDVSTAKNMNKDLERFIFLNEKTKTGAAYDNVIGSKVGGWLSDNVREMASLTDKLTPGMRQGLPGAASEKDVQMFRNATVGIGKNYRVNKDVATGLRAANQNIIDRQQFMQDYLAEHGGHLRGSERAWNEYLEANPIFDPDTPDGSFILNGNRQSYRDWSSKKTLPNKTSQGVSPNTQGDDLTPEEQAELEYLRSLKR